MKSLAATWIILLTAGCGYHFGHAVDHSEISVAIFDNLTERRHHELDLTRQVIRELAHAGVKIDPKAPVELRGEIVEIGLPALAESQTDQVLVGAFSMSVRCRLVEKATGKVLWEESASGRGSFTDLRGKPVEAARQEAFREIGSKIAARFDARW
ncbi:MAG TPA: hypothetical protein VI643_06770 [Planctomycetota bacterium]|nr:hypothetical protein [Planctomycetota bacterium]